MSSDKLKKEVKSKRIAPHGLLCIFTLIPFLLAGCFDPKVTLITGPNKTMQCTDTRDGEVFSYETDSAHGGKFGGANGASFRIVDNDGNIRELKKNMELYLKCKEIKSR